MTASMSAPTTRALKLIDGSSTAGAVVGGAATALLMVHVVADVIGRYFFNHPLPGTLDITQYGWMPTIVSLGLGYALLCGEHIRVNLLTAPTRQRTQRVIEVVSMVFTLGAVLAFIWFGFEQAVAAMNYGEHAVAVTWFAIWPYRWVMLLGLVILALQAIGSLIRAVSDPEFDPDDADETQTAIEQEESMFDLTEDRNELVQEKTR